MQEIRHYIVQIAQGLSYLHDCGTIHMDIKPENILITPLDTVKIIDFGLARRLGTHDVLQVDFTRPHGTPYYAAPEQLELYRNDPRTDLYSLGLVFYEMLTGVLPFERSTKIAKVRQRLKEPPMPPSRHRPDIPEKIERIILKCLARDPRQRFSSAGAFIEALEATGTEPSRREEKSGVTPGKSKCQSDALTCSVYPTEPASMLRPYSILAAVADDDRADDVVAAALYEAITAGGGVTLLTVVQPEDDSELTRYGDAVRGKALAARLEKFVRRFRRLGIDPVVRIRPGSPADTIVDTAADIRADLIILGPSRKGLFKRIFGGGTIDRVLKKAPCRVLVARDVPAPRIPEEVDP